MAETVVTPRIRGFICTSSHPFGCAANVARQAKIAQASIPSERPERYRVLILGASTGYGLAGRIAATVLYGAETLGIFFEKNGEGTKTGSPGYYNTIAFDRLAKEAGVPAYHINGDAFSQGVREAAIAKIRETMGQVDVVIYSLAAPRRTDPATGQVYSSALKPVGERFVGKSIDLNTEELITAELQPATEEEIEGTVRVMGGDDLRLWTEALLEAGVLAQGASIIPLSYIGPEITQAIYRTGTIGKAKEHLEATTQALDALMQERVNGRALVSVNKMVLTQASAAIPTVPLYYSVVTPILRERGTHEEPIHQMVRLFTTQIGPGQTPLLDHEQRIRLDNHEMEKDVQAEVMQRWEQLTPETLGTLADFADYKRGFRQLFGFEIEGVDYDIPVEVEAVAL
jgi:enoyl-[acyl-carrier protein] reductase/trans-2-enoyl-CoA reductase (NAD+)